MTVKMKFPGMLERFFSYVKIDTQSDESSKDFPSTAKQLNLLKLLKQELTELGLQDVQMTARSYVLGTLPSNQSHTVPSIALIAHVDTSPDVSGENVSPLVHANYNGEDIALPKAGVVIKAAENPYLKKKKGKTVITSDGATLLGADDKAGITEIMCALKFLIDHPKLPRPNIRVVFTPDEEIGRGTDYISLEEIKADYGYTVDGEKLGEVEDETFCADTVEIAIKGVNVHPGYAKKKLVNAIKIGAKIIASLPKNSMSPETTDKRQGYIHPNQFSGNVEAAHIKLLIRDFEESGLKQKEQLIEQIVSGVRLSYPKASVDMKVTQSYRNMKCVISQHPQVVEKALEAVKMSGVKPKRNIIRGGTDGARLSFMGLPTPNIFTGGSNFHSRQEWIALEDMEKASKVLVNLMQLWAE